MMNQMMTDWVRGIERLDLTSPVFAKFVRAMGRPIDNPSIPTARVMWDRYSKRVTFEMNSEFTKDLTDEGVAAAMAHETYHVLLNHLKEVTEVAKYPRHNLLTIAHECIINDGLQDNVGVSLPDGFWSGPEKFDQDFSYFSTQQAYDFILQKLQEEQDQQDQQAQQDGGAGDASSADGEAGQSSSGGASSGTQDSSKGDESKNDDSSSDEKDSTEGGADNADADADENSAAGDGAEDEHTKSEDGESEGDAAGGDAEDDSDDTTPTSCGGVDVEGMDPQDLKDFADAMKKMVQGVVDDVGEENLPDDVADILSEVFGTQMGKGGPQQDSFYAPDPTKGMELNWAEILTIINPQMKTRGKPKPKETWQRSPRRLVSIYPQVILPDRIREVDDPNAKGKEIPTFVVALDLSYSIPRHLVQSLLKLVDSVPTKIISARPITWSDNVVEYDADTRRIANPGGTDIDNVYRYAKKVAKELGSDPYVMVITDGQCYFSTPVDAEYLKRQWFWGAIQARDEAAIRSNFVQRGHANTKYIYKLTDLVQ